jgi:fibronectin-binding autotransporter adhesin
LTVGGVLAVNAGEFDLTGGGLVLNGTMTTAAGATANWTGGNLTAGTSGGTLAGTLIAAGGSKSISGLTLRNSGTLVWSSGVIVAAGGPTQLTNLSAGVVDFRADGVAFVSQNGAPGTLANQGTLRKSAGGTSGTTSTSVQWAVDLQNGGTIDARVGILNLDGGGTLDNGTTTITGAGVVALDAGTFTVATGAPFTATGSGAANLFWTGGNLTSGTSVGTMAGTLIAAGGTKSISGTALQNGGTLAWTGGTIVAAGGVTVLTNLFGGVVDFRGDGVAFVSQNGAPGTLVNQGTLRKSAGGNAGTTSTSVQWAVDLQGGGTIDAQVGILNFDAGGTLNTGTTTITGAGVAALDGGNFTVATGAPFTATGSGGANLYWTGGNLTSGTSVGTVAGTLIAAGGTKSISGTALQNGGTLAWTGGAILAAGGVTELTNISGGVVDFRADGVAFVNQNGAPGTLVNQGILRKSAGGASGATSTSVQWAVDLRGGGTIDAQVGILNFDAGGTLNTGITTITGAGIAALDSGNFTVAPGAPFTAIGSGGASLFWTGGNLTSGSSVGTVAGTLIAAGGTKSISGTALQNGGALAWTSGIIFAAAGPAQLLNLPAGVVDFRADGTAFANQNGAPGTLVNQGTLRKSVGGTSGATSTSVQWAVDLQGGGTIDAQVGILNFDGGGTLDTGTTAITGAGIAALDGGTFTVATGAPFTAAGSGGASLNWTGGNLTAGGGGGTIAGTLIAAGGTKSISGTALQNGGTLAWTGGTILAAAGTAQLINLPTGVIDFRADGTAFANQNGAPGILVNQGTLRKSGGGASSATATSVQWAVDLQGGGMIDAQVGILNFDGGGTLNTGITKITGAGIAALDGGTFTVATGAPFTAAGSGGATLNWTGGNLTAGGGGGTIAGTLIGAGGAKSISGTTLQNGGTLAWTGGTIFAAAGTALLINLPAGVIDFRADGTAFANQNGAPGFLVNQGTLRKSAGGTSGATSTSVQWAVDLQGGGTIDAQVGILNLDGGGTLNTGITTITGAGVAALDGGTFTVATGAPFTAAGSGGANLNWTGGNLTAGSGGGTIAGTLVAAGGTKSFSGTTLQIGGALTWTGGSILAAGGTTVLINLPTGVINIQADGTAFANQNGAAGILLNQGALRKSAGATGAGTTVAWAITNTGTIQNAAAGTLILSGGLTNTNPGVLEVESGTLQVAGGTAFTNYAGGSLDGGTYRVMANSTLDFTTSRPVTTLGPNASVDLIGVNSTFAAITGLTTNNGTFSLQSSRSFVTAGDFTNTGTLDIQTGSTLTVTGAYTNTGTVTGAGTVAVANATFVGGTYNGTVTFTVTGALTIAGPTTIGSGRVNVNGNTAVNFPLTIPAGITLGGTGPVTVQTGSMLTVNGAVDPSKAISVSGTLQGSGTAGSVALNSGMLQGSGGTLALTSVTAAGASTIQNAVNVSGPSSVASGTLTVAPGATFGGAGSLTVNAAGTLAVQGTVNLPTTVSGVLMGSGNVTGAVVIQPGGFLRPGNSPGTIVVGGSLTLDGDYDWDLNGNDNSLAGSIFDKVNGSGAVTLSASARINVKIGSGVSFTNPFWAQSETWPILTGAGGFTDNTIPQLTVNTTSYQTPYPQATFSFAETANVLNVIWNPGLGVSIWTGGGGGNWNSPNNWAPASVPAGNMDTQLTFGPNPNPAMTNDVPGTFTLNALTFTSGSPVYTLSGNGLDFVTNSLGAPPRIATNSANSVTIGVALTLSSNLTVTGTGNITLNGPIGGSGSLTMVGAGTVTLGNAANNFTGGTVAQNGAILVAADSALGTGNVTGGPLGALTYINTTATSRSFVMNGGAVSVAANQTLTFNSGAEVSSATLTGPGTVAGNGALFDNVTAAASVVIVSNSAADRFVHFTSSAALSVAGGVNSTGASTIVNMNGFTNQAVGSITIGPASRVNVANLQSYGTLTLTPAVVGNTNNQITLLTNAGTSPLFFDGGSKTFLGTPATAGPPTAPNFVAGIDLHGNNAVVAGGLFVNNGFVVDSANNGQGTATVIADFGALVKGAGYFQNPIITQNGGKVQAGNSPGPIAFGRFVFGPGGVSNYVFAIDDAAGTAGPSPDALGHVSGWGLIDAVKQSYGSATATGDFAWTATSSAKLTVAIDTLVNPTTVGTDVAGPMADFDPNNPYSWPAARWSGTYAGPTDAAALDAATSFDASGFVNPMSGTFGWSLDPAGQTLSLTYTPTAVPEPGSLGLAAWATAGFACLRRWRRARK